MTFETLIFTPFREMLVKVGSFIPTLLISFGILIIGWVFALLVRKGITHLLRTIEFDKVSDKMGATKFLKTGGIRREPSDAVGCVVYCLLMIMVMIITVKALGIAFAGELIDSLLAYVPHVISGTVVLIIGMYLARFVSLLVYIAAKNTDMPIPSTLARLTKIAIVAYVGIVYLTEVGFVTLFTGAHYTIFMGGIVFALALSFGLAGKDVASHYLEVFKSRKS